LRAIWRPPSDTVKQAPVGAKNFLQTETQAWTNVPEGTGIGNGRQTFPTTGSLKHTLPPEVAIDTQVALGVSPS
jgi:hypothetical protein